MFLGGNDDGVALRFFWNGCYEPTTLKLWTKFAMRSELALDIGAHTGAFTLSAKAAKAGLTVASFEPHSMNFARMNLNLRFNRFETSNSFMCAVDAKDETLPFSISTSLDYLTTGGSIGTRGKGYKTQVQVIAVDSFIPDAVKPRVGLVKIDTEGYEAACIMGMTKLLELARPVFFFECIESSSGAAVQKALSAFGYEFYEVDDNQGTVKPVAEIRPHLDARDQPIYGVFNRIATPDSVEWPE